MQAAFANVSVSSLAAGGSRACGVKAATGWDAGVLPQSDLDPHRLAIGDSHACGLRGAGAEDILLFLPLQQPADR